MVLKELALTLGILIVGGVAIFGFVLLLGWAAGKLAAGLCWLFKWRPKRHVPLDSWLDEMLDLDRTEVVDMDRTRLDLHRIRIPSKPVRRGRHVAKHRKDA